MAYLCRLLISYSAISMLKVEGTIASAAFPASRSTNLRGLVLTLPQCTCDPCVVIRHKRSNRVGPAGTLAQGRSCLEPHRSEIPFFSKEGTTLSGLLAFDINNELFINQS